MGNTATSLLISTMDLEDPDSGSKMEQWTIKPKAVKQFKLYLKRLEEEGLAMCNRDVSLFLEEDDNKPKGEKDG